MDNLCPITYAKARVKERGYTNYRLVFRDLQLQPNESRTVNAYNEIWLLLESDEGVRVASDYGIYDYKNANLMEQIHEHADRITLVNTLNTKQNVRFLQVIMVVAQEVSSKYVSTEKL